MPEQQLQQFGHLVSPHLEPEERVLDIASVQSARASVGVMLGLAGTAGQVIVDRAAVKARTGKSGARSRRSPVYLEVHSLVGGRPRWRSVASAIALVTAAGAPLERGSCPPLAIQCGSVLICLRSRQAGGRPLPNPRFTQVMRPFIG